MVGLRVLGYKGFRVSAFGGWVGLKVQGLRLSV